MIPRSRFPLGVVLAVLPTLMLLVTTPVVAQPTERPCVENVAPVDDFQSAGLGLTREELIALYGEEGIRQGSIFYDFRGFDLHKVGCDLILAFPLTGVEVGQVIDEAALAEALLPADAEFVGSFAQGTTIFLARPFRSGAAPRSRNALPKWERIAEETSSSSIHISSTDLNKARFSK